MFNPCPDSTLPPPLHRNYSLLPLLPAFGGRRCEEGRRRKRREEEGKEEKRDSPEIFVLCISLLLSYS
jgi:hypothetical protein